MYDANPVDSVDGYSALSLDALVDRGWRFGTIYADPPWRYDCSPRGAASRHYATMGLGEIAALPVRKLTGENAHLHLWTTHSFLFEAKKILEDWGFCYKGVFVWVKPHHQMGTGYYWRSAAEYLLLGVKGTGTFPDKSIPNWILHDRGEHSAKPEAVRNLIERVSPGPYLELFGRKAVHGWVVFGDQVSRGLFDENVEAIE